MPVFIGFLVVIATIYQLFFRYERSSDSAHPGQVYERDSLTGKTQLVPEGGSNPDMEARKDVYARILAENPDARPEDFDSSSSIANGTPAQTGSNSWDSNARPASSTTSTSEAAVYDESGLPPLNGANNSSWRRRQRNQSASNNNDAVSLRENEEGGSSPIPGYGDSGQDGDEVSQQRRPSLFRSRLGRFPLNQRHGAPVPGSGATDSNQTADFEPLIPQRSGSEDRRRTREREIAIAQESRERSAPVPDSAEHSSRRVMLARVAVPVRPITTEPMHGQVQQVVERPIIRSWDWRDLTRVTRLSQPVIVPNSNALIQASSSPPTPGSHRVNRVADVRARPYATRKIDLDQDGYQEEVIQSATGHDGLLDISIVKNGREIFFGRGRQLAVLPARNPSGWCDIVLKAGGKIMGVYRYNPVQNAYTSLSEQGNSDT
jgi:hypothetical protein